LFHACGRLICLYVLYHSKMHVHRQDGGGSEKIVGGESCLALKVVVMDSADVLSVDELVNILEGVY
jgi:hypothetical protein